MLLIERTRPHRAVMVWEEQLSWQTVQAWYLLEGLWSLLRQRELPRKLSEPSWARFPEAWSCSALLLS